jgi:hypothetical protein
MKDLVANLLISCRFDLVGSEHETQEDERGLVGDAIMERSRSKGEAQQNLHSRSRSFTELPLPSTTAIYGLSSHIQRIV